MENRERIYTYTVTPTTTTSSGITSTTPVVVTSTGSGLPTTGFSSTTSPTFVSTGSSGVPLSGSGISTGGLSGSGYSSTQLSSSGLSSTGLGGSGLSGSGLSTGISGARTSLGSGLPPVTSGLSSGISGASVSGGPGSFVYTVPHAETISATSRVHPTEVAAGPSVHPTEHMVSQLRPTDTLETTMRFHNAEALTAGMAPPTEAMTALRFQAREVPLQQQSFQQQSFQSYQQPQQYQYQTVSASEVRPTTITTIPATVITSSSASPRLMSHPAHVVPMVPVESHQMPAGSETIVERDSFKTVEVLPTTTSQSFVSSAPATSIGTTSFGTSGLGTTTLGTTSVVGETTSMATSGLGTPLATGLGTSPVATTPSISTTPGLVGTAAPVHHEEKKQGFFSHLFHHGHGAAATAGAAAAAGTTRDPLTEQAERFIDNLAKHPRELSYYEQFVVQYNRGMRFSPMQARRLVEVLIKNSSARGATVPYYSVYALELLLKLAIADPIVHSELARIDDQQLSLLRMNRYIANDETKPLGLNFMLYLYRFLGRTRYQDWVVSKKPEKDKMWHSEIESYIMSQQNMEIAMFLEGISRRLPPLLPHAPIGEHLMPSYATTTTVPATTFVEKTFVERPITTTTVTEVVREVPTTSTTFPAPAATTTNFNTMGTSTVYKPAF